MNSMKKLIYALLVALVALVGCKGRRGAGNNPGNGNDSTVTAVSLPADPDDGDVEGLNPEQVAYGRTEPGMPTEPVASTGKAVTVGGVVEFDKTVHDFGDILQSDGPKTCTFKLTNVSSEPLAIFEVVSSCGCTDAKWTREPIQPGQSGKISATYKNEDGPYPFDKTLTVYISALNKPVILRLRGVVHEKAVSLAELYGPGRIGNLGLKDKVFKAGNMDQGNFRTDEAKVANLGSTPLNVEFTNLSPQLSVSVEPNPIPAGEVAVMSFTVKADRNLWGRNNYYATPVLNGKPAGEKITWWAVTKENFSSWDDEKRLAAAQPLFDESTAIFDVVEKGQTVTATYNYTNRGKSPLHIYKLDADAAGVSVISMEDCPAGEKGSVSISLDTSELPLGDATIMMTLITNSPQRPIINLFLAGVVK